MIKQCPRCKKEKPLEEWTKSKKRPGGVGAYCKICNKEKTAEWFSKNKERHFELYIKRIYKLTIEEYNSILEKQNWTCALCDNKDDLCVDHCHDTGRVRGILCQFHNRALGQFNDNPEFLKKAIKYLTKK